MKKKVTMGTLLKKVGGGLKRVEQWMGRLLGFKKGMSCQKGLVHAMKLCGLVFCLTVAGACINVAYRYGKRMLARWQYERMEHATDNHVRKLSKDVVIHYCSRYGESYVYNKVTDEKTLEDIVWITESKDGDNLVCFFDGKKRGYFDRTTGEVVILAEYDHAWIFSDSVAAVVKDERLSFIDHQGKPITSQTFYYMEDVDYCFHDGTCIVYEEKDKKGVIDKQGNWVVPPVYQDVEKLANGCWRVETHDDTYGVFTNEGKRVLPDTFRSIIYCHDTQPYYKVLTWEHVDQVLDMEGNVVNPCDYCSITQLLYHTEEMAETQVNDEDEYDEYDVEYDDDDWVDNSTKQAVAHCLKYSTSDDHYGLMDKKGNVITPPLYSSIHAIAVDRYQCEAEYGSVILDDTGRECGLKPNLEATP